MMALILKMGRRRVRRKCCPAFCLHCFMIQALCLLSLLCSQHLPAGLSCANWRMAYITTALALDTVFPSNTATLSPQHLSDRFLVQS